MSNQLKPSGMGDPCCEVSPLVTEPLNAPAAAVMAARFKALSDPVRLRLLSAVASHAGGQACVCDITDGLDALGVGQPTISHHLKVLREAGLLTSQRRGSWVYYAVVPEALTELSALLSGVPATAAAAAR
ncbi:MAG: metalloregulator ArsR/SmtB family transcription factor [Mycobacterium pseudokansasii]|uniref:Arsenic resistance transcriptional regulator ArsR1 n=2 Tax=Mycobacterium pseudokansasii TaxID=2341080 RepID=A0A498QW84_9MYCO|nr:transcriptional regulator [Mycobacterium kansasii]MBY0390965.1 metalloregulator ArsR/SmtB family transcription factor [Mycobacterium pseudokansasii]VAZ94492.1 Arsenic resistance transcriptional regulator ArsR1 [Mycobacterium pseudokansasii]VAZ95500.1 Arsenic resistance transcriptional regulator ArsR1 [Mycobacterium pseudokansasii]VBA50317.1 Arsenic resistance transcriptional regulator ArsR1 [Mycobacterium pseudokansasii]